MKPREEARAAAGHSLLDLVESHVVRHARQDEFLRIPKALLENTAGTRSEGGVMATL